MTRYWKLIGSERVIAIDIEATMSPRWEVVKEEDYLEYKKKKLAGEIKEDVELK